jgi:hypothetical protein
MQLFDLTVSEDPAYPGFVVALVTQYGGEVLCLREALSALPPQVLSTQEQPHMLQP